MSSLHIIDIHVNIYRECKHDDFEIDDVTRGEKTWRSCKPQHFYLHLHNRRIPLHPSIHAFSEPLILLRIIQRAWSIKWLVGSQDCLCCCKHENSFRLSITVWGFAADIHSTICEFSSRKRGFHLIQIRYRGFLLSRLRLCRLQYVFILLFMHYTTILLTFCFIHLQWFTLKL